MLTIHSKELLQLLKIEKPVRYETISIWLQQQKEISYKRLQ